MDETSVVEGSSDTSTVRQPSAVWPRQRTRVGLDGAADEHRSRCRRQMSPVRQDLAHLEASGTVEDHPEGPFIGVREHQDDGAGERRIDESGGREE
jgi:hypothetical protein